MPSLSADALEALIDRYLTGDLDARTAEQVRAYLDATPERRGVMAAVRTAIRGELFEGSPIDVQEARRALLAKLAARDSVTQPGGAVVADGIRQGVSPASVPSVDSQRDGSRYRDFGMRATRPIGSLGVQPLRWRAWSVVMAMISVIVTLGLSVRGLHISVSGTASALTYATGNGERATITLPDGGMVVLNVASRLEVPMDYMEGHHTIRLHGEGLFTVQHHDGAPLTVLAGGAVVRVLGTSFVVQHYTSDTATQIVVRDGKVTVGGTVLTSGQMIDVSGRLSSPVRASDGSPFLFATGVLALPNLALSTAIPALDRWYDADIRLGDPVLATERVQGRFPAGSLSDLSEILRAMFDVRVVRDGRVLTLFPR